MVTSGRMSLPHYSEHNESTFQLALRLPPKSRSSALFTVVSPSLCERLLRFFRAVNAGFAGDIGTEGRALRGAGFAETRIGFFHAVEGVCDEIGSGAVVQGAGVVQYGEQFVG